MTRPQPASAAIGERASIALESVGASPTANGLPHFSRTDSRSRLEESGRWLGEIVQATPRA
jgi:hypothetical protein